MSVALYHYVRREYNGRITIQPVEAEANFLSYVFGKAGDPAFNVRLYHEAGGFIASCITRDSGIRDLFLDNKTGAGSDGVVDLPASFRSTISLDLPSVLPMIGYQRATVQSDTGTKSISMFRSVPSGM